MNNQQTTDPIEQFASGQTPFPNVDSAITHIAAGNEQAQQLAQLKIDQDSHASSSATITSDKPITLGDLLSEHIPEHQRADILALVHEKQNSMKEEASVEINKSNEIG